MTLTSHNCLFSVSWPLLSIRHVDLIYQAYNSTKVWTAAVLTTCVLLSFHIELLNLDVIYCEPWRGCLLSRRLVFPCSSISWLRLLPPKANLLCDASVVCLQGSSREQACPLQSRRPVKRTSAPHLPLSLPPFHPCTVKTAFYHCICLFLCSFPQASRKSLTLCAGSELFAAVWGEWGSGYGQRAVERKRRHGNIEFQYYSYVRMLNFQVMMQKQIVCLLGGYFRPVWLNRNSQSSCFSCSSFKAFEPWPLFLLWSAR